MWLLGDTWVISTRHSALLQRWRRWTDALSQCGVHSSETKSCCGKTWSTLGSDDQTWSGQGRGENTAVAGRRGAGFDLGDELTVVVVQGSDSGSDTLSQLAMEAGLERPQGRNSGLLGQGEGKERVEEGKEDEVSMEIIPCLTTLLAGLLYKELFLLWKQSAADQVVQSPGHHSEGGGSGGEGGQEPVWHDDGSDMKGSCDTISTALDLRRRRGVRRLVDKGGQIRLADTGGLVCSCNHISLTFLRTKN